ncbi:MAG: hypothetical protein ACTHJY_22650 [Rhizobiaceae bacterium]
MDKETGRWIVDDIRLPHCGKDYLATDAFPSRFTCRECAAAGKTEPIQAEA